MQQKRKIIILCISLVLICLIGILVFFNSENIKIFFNEVKYKNNSSTDNLVKLCASLEDTNNYNKIVKYYPELLDNDKAFNNVSKYFVSSLDGKKVKNSDKDKVHDQMQCTYLLSYLYMNRFDDFKKKCAEYFPKFKTKGYGYAYGNFAIVGHDNKDTSTKQAREILEVLQENLTKAKEKPLCQASNLDAQSVIYERLGDSKNQEATSKKSQVIMKTIIRNKSK